MQVSGSDPEQIGVQLMPGDRDIRFTVEVDWISDGEPGSEVLDSGGDGFRVMGDGALPTYGFPNGKPTRIP